MAKISISPFTIDLLARQANTYRAGKEAAYQAQAERDAADERQQAYFDFAKAQQEAAWGRDDFTRERDINEQNAGYGAAYGGYLGGVGSGDAGRVPQLSTPEIPHPDSSFDYQPNIPSSPMGGRVPQLAALTTPQPQLNYDLGGAAPPSAQGIPQITTAPPNGDIIDQALAQRAQSQLQQAPSAGGVPQISTQGLFGSPEGLEGGALNSYYNTVAPTISGLIAREAQHNQELGWTQPQTDAFAAGRTYILNALPDLDSMSDEEYNQAISKLPEIAAAMNIPQANINDFVDGALNMTSDIGFRPGGRATPEQRSRAEFAANMDNLVGRTQSIALLKNVFGMPIERVAEELGITVEEAQRYYEDAGRYGAPAVRSGGGEGTASTASGFNAPREVLELFKTFDTELEQNWAGEMTPEEFYNAAVQSAELIKLTGESPVNTDYGELAGMLIAEYAKKIAESSE